MTIKKFITLGFAVNMLYCMKAWYLGFSNNLALQTGSHAFAWDDVASDNSCVNETIHLDCDCVSVYTVSCLTSDFELFLEKPS